MRTVRVFFTGIATLALVGGLPLITAAQDEILTPELQTGFVYGVDDPARQVLHVYTLESRETPRPAVIMPHGGGLISGSPDMDQGWGRKIARQGYVTIRVGYRLFNPETGANPWPAQLDDAQRAVRWVRAHADEFDIDPERICAIGRSSGGHLAALLGTTESFGVLDPDLAGLSSRVDCVVSVAGDVDVTVSYPDPFWTGVFEGMFGATLEEDRGAWEAASPVYHVDDETVPFLILHGTHDDEVPVEAARNLADALAAAEREFVHAEVPAGHMSLEGHAAVDDLTRAFLAYQLEPER